MPRVARRSRSRPSRKTKSLKGSRRSFKNLNDVREAVVIRVCLLLDTLPINRLFAVAGIVETFAAAKDEPAIIHGYGKVSTEAIVKQP